MLRSLVGSEMCIRDSITQQQPAIPLIAHITPRQLVIVLYTVTQLLLQRTMVTNEEPEVDDFLVYRSAIEHT